MEENIRLKQAGSLPMATEAVESETILAVDASGNMNRVPVDAEPAENSNKLIKSGGVFAAIASAITAAIASIKTWVGDGFAKIDGWYSTLVSGAAENLVGHGSVPAEYTFRTSGGTADLGTGNAPILRLLGKSIVWNQLVDADTTEVATVSGRKYLTVIGGTATIVTSDGTAISVTGGTDKVYDLTLMFGAGNEPSTIAAFTALYPLINDYDYTATPQIINVTASGIKTTGFNQWDEEWENGYLHYENGTTVPGGNTYFCSKNFIPVIPGKEYYFKYNNVYTRIAGYDAEKNYDQSYWYDPSDFIDGKVTIPDNIHFLKFYSKSSTYHNDICINLSWSGYRNGEYEPYEEHILYFNGEDGSLATVTGKLNGEGESVTIFTDGMRSCGSTHDEIGGYVNGYLTKGVVRIGNRAYEAGDESDSSVMTDGTTTNYVLDTPLEYILDEPIPANYYINDFGTEERLPADTASVVAAPILYDVQYAMNAVDTLRRLPVNFISKASMDNFTTELASKLGTAMNATIAITPTYDSEHEEYDYEITITPNEP